MQFVYIYKIFIDIFMTLSFFFCIYGVISTTFLKWFGLEFQIHFIRIGVFLIFLLIDNKILSYQKRIKSPLTKERFYLVFQSAVINLLLLNIFLEYIKLFLLAFNN